MFASASFFGCEFAGRIPESSSYIPALLGVQSTVWGDSHMLPSRGVRVWVVYLAQKIERIIVLLSASPEGEARLPMPKGMAYKE
jgi:hypothetical protein